MELKLKIPDKYKFLSVDFVCIALWTDKPVFKSSYSLFERRKTGIYYRKQLPYNPLWYGFLYAADSRLSPSETPKLYEIINDDLVETEFDTEK